MEEQEVSNQGQGSKESGLTQLNIKFPSQTFGTQKRSRTVGLPNTVGLITGYQKMWFSVQPRCTGCGSVIRMNKDSLVTTVFVIGKKSTCYIQWTSKNRLFS